MGNGVLVDVAAGGLAGVAETLLSYPLDLVKTQQQLSTASRPPSVLVSTMPLLQCGLLPSFERAPSDAASLFSLLCVGFASAHPRRKRHARTVSRSQCPAHLGNPSTRAQVLCEWALQGSFVQPARTDLRRQPWSSEGGEGSGRHRYPGRGCSRGD
eukprot:SAG31_NODE_8971_length_1355_cov_1.338376_1_plen_156_part_00